MDGMVAYFVMYTKSGIFKNNTRDYIIDRKNIYGSFQNGPIIDNMVVRDSNLVPMMMIHWN
jgi:hypothetical protein